MGRLLFISVSVSALLCQPAYAQTGCSRPSNISVNAWNAMSADAQAAMCRAARGLPPAPPTESKQTESERAQARQALLRPYHANPAACHDGWLAGDDNYIVALEPWAEAAGLE